MSCIPEPWERVQQQENVWNWVWARSVVFFATFVATLYVAASPLSEQVTILIQKQRAPWIDGLLTNTVGRLADLSHSALSGTRSALSWLPDSAPFVNNVFRWIEHITCVIVPPVIDLGAVALPGFLKPWLDAYKHNPTWIAIWGCIISLLIAIGSWMENQIHGNMRKVWTPIVSNWDLVRAWDPIRAWDLKLIAPAPRVDLVPEPRNPLYLMRTSKPYQLLILVMKYYVLPTFFAALFLIVGLAAVGAFWLALVE